MSARGPNEPKRRRASSENRHGVGAGGLHGHQVPQETRVRTRGIGGWTYQKVVPPRLGVPNREVQAFLLGREKMRGEGGTIRTVEGEN